MSAHASVALTLDGPLAVATLARAPVNAIDEEWLARLDEALSIIERAEGVSALLVRSTERIFSAGADLELMRGRFDTAQGRERMVAFVRDIQRVYARLARLPQVTIAELGGAALGLVQWVVPAAELPARAMAVAAGIAALPAAAVAACKRCIHASLDQGVDGYEMEVEATAALLASGATQERVRQFLARKR